MSRMPWLARLGLVVLLLGGASDVAIHLSEPGPSAALTPPAQFAHLAVLVGMVISLAGIFADGVRRQFQRKRRQPNP